MNIKVSIIVPVYNVEKFIEKSVRSLFAQSLDKIEYIFINDNTSDSSFDIINTVLQDFPERKNQIKIINHTINHGTGKSRQEGRRLDRR